MECEMKILGNKDETIDVNIELWFTISLGADFDCRWSNLDTLIE